MIPVTSASPPQHVSRMCPWLRTADPIPPDARREGGGRCRVGRAWAARLVAPGVSPAEDDDRRPLTGVGGADEGVAAVVEPAGGRAEGRLGPNGRTRRDVGP